MARVRSNVLIVEGTNDRYFINQILTAHGYRKSPRAVDGNFIVERAADGTEIAIVHAGGFDNIPRTLKDLLKPDDVNALAIVADMDRREDGRWVSLKGMLSNERYSGLPDVLPNDGLVRPQPDNPALGVWLMPDNSSPGMTETFAASLVPPKDESWEHALSTVNELPPFARRFADKDRDKAALHTWLAWQPEPGCQTGAAVTKRFLDVSRPLAVAFIAWIERWLEAGTNRSTPT